jgi:RNA polymerase sigma factor (sigma-70 family)
VTERHIPRADRMPGQFACPLDDDAHVIVRNAIVEAHKHLIKKIAYKACWRQAHAGSYGDTKQRFDACKDDFINGAWEEALREFHKWDPSLAEFGVFVRPVIQRALYALIGRDYCVVRGGVADRSWDTPIATDANEPDAPRTLGDAISTLPDGSVYKPGRSVGNLVEDAMIDRLDTKLRQDRLRRAIRAMPPGRDRNVLEWRLLAGLDHTEIAERLGVGVSTARKCFSRAMPGLKVSNVRSHPDAARATYRIEGL